MRPARDVERTSSGLSPCSARCCGRRDRVGDVGSPAFRDERRRGEIASHTAKDAHQSAESLLFHRERRASVSARDVTPHAWSASPGLQHVADVAERGRGSDVAAQAGNVAVAGDVGDLALLPSWRRPRPRSAPSGETVDRSANADLRRAAAPRSAGPAPTRAR